MKGMIGCRHFGWRDPHLPAEFNVNLGIDVAGKGESQRRGDPAIALDDVAVVPNGWLPLVFVDRALRWRQAGDRSCLKEIEPPIFQRPLNILRGTAFCFHLGQQHHQCADGRWGKQRGRLDYLLV